MDSLREALLHHLDGNTELLRDMAKVFLETTPGMLADLRAAIDQKDCRQLERAAHTLKGSLSYLAATHAVGTAQTLEHMGRAGELSNAAESYAALERHLQGLWQALAELAQCE